MTVAAQAPRRAVMTSVLAVMLACGVRTGLPGDESGTGNLDTGDTVPPGPDPREGGCDHPIPLPFANVEAVRGRLRGPSRDEGWCGDGENDAGAEDTYLITPTFDTDVIVSILPETEFTPTLRATRDGCYSDDDNLPRMCAAPVGDYPYWHFLAEAGHEYSLTIDSPEGTDGKYAMRVFYGPPELSACPIHSTQINQAPGGYFTWSNELGGKGGRVDGRCGGPGNENMFQVNVSYPGTITFFVTADDSFAPILSVRTGCGGSSEVTCTSMAQQGTSSFALPWFFEPGTYYIVVDQDDVKGGEYSLEVFSD
jgi:hypothetical protein